MDNYLILLIVVLLLIFSYLLNQLANCKYEQERVNNFMNNTYKNNTIEQPLYNEGFYASCPKKSKCFNNCQGKKTFLKKCKIPLQQAKLSEYEQKLFDKLLDNMDES